jgi:hypothetical protein
MELVLLFIIVMSAISYLCILVAVPKETALVEEQLMTENFVEETKQIEDPVT